MSWVSEIAGSHRLQLAVTAVVSGCIAASAVLGLQEARKEMEALQIADDPICGLACNAAEAVV